MGYNDKQEAKPKSKFRKLFMKRKWLIIIGVIIIALIVIAGVYFIYFNSKTPAIKVNPIYTSNKVNSIVADKGYQAGENFLDTELKETNNPKDQAILYENKAIITGSVALGNDKAKALQYAYKAESLNPSDVTAMMIAAYEESLGNIQNAIKYYNLYLERLPKTSLNKSDYDYYAARVKQLEASLKK